MKVAVISGHTPSLFWFRTDMMKCFIRHGCEVIALGNEEEAKWKEKFGENGIRYIQIAVSRNGTNPLNDVKTLRSIKEVLKREKPDKIFTYQVKTVIYGGLAAHQLGIKEVYPLIAGLGSVFLSSGAKAKVLRVLLKTEYKAALKHAKKVFFQNRDDVAFFVANKMVREEQVVMMNGSGVNLNEFQPMPLPPEPTFLCISRLIRDKGVMEYLEAARLVKATHPQARFLLVGPYDTNPSAVKPEELQPYLSDGTVEYFGEQTDVRPYLAQCRVFVLPSYREGTPKTVLEAMASYRAVITTDAPGCRETVSDGVNGVLVPVRDIAALAEKMTELLLDEEKTAKMAAAGRKIAEEKYDVEKVNQTVCATMNL